MDTKRFQNRESRLVDCFGFNDPLRQYFSLYRAVSQRQGERGEKIDEGKNVQTTPPAPTASAIGPCPTVIKIVGRPGTGSLPSTIASPDHPQQGKISLRKGKVGLRFSYAVSMMLWPSTSDCLYGN